MLRRVVLAALLSLAPALALAPAAHAAIPMKVPCATGNECIWVYYNNAQHTTETGTVVINCSGVEYKSGTVTAYDTYDQYACSNVR
ncbi:MAG TPA: hypothetical protein VGH27_27095 [Streptosporangiaceae bacterium]|jgi:hypothetical protein